MVYGEVEQPARKLDQWISHLIHFLIHLICKKIRIKIRIVIRESRAAAGRRPGVPVNGARRKNSRPARQTELHRTSRHRHDVVVILSHPPTIAQQLPAPRTVLAQSESAAQMAQRPTPKTGTIAGPKSGATGGPKIGTTSRTKSRTTCRTQNGTTWCAPGGAAGWIPIQPQHLP